MSGKLTWYLADKLGGEFSAFKVRRAVVSREEGALYAECVFERVLTAAEKDAVEAAVRELLPQTFSKIELIYKKSYVDDEILTKEILDYFAGSFAALRGRLTASDLDITIGEPVSVCVRMDAHAKELVDKQKLLPKLQGYLNNRYCGSFVVSEEQKAGESDTAQMAAELLKKRKKLEEEQQEDCSATRYAVEDRREFIGKLIEESARLISDASVPEENVVIAGKVRGVTCKTVSSGKTMYKFTLSDCSGEMPCTYFPAAQNTDKLTDEFVDGTEAILRGTVKTDAFSRDLAFMPRAITFCKLPEGMQKKEMVSKKVPEEYTTVFPEKLVLGEQVELFAGNSDRPAQAVKSGRFVVFDLETTGLEPATCRITEIGAVSIVNGEIAESFSSLVNPQVFIPEEITKLTGITEEMVKDAPVISAVLPDFFKFSEGATLVAHNIEFDYKFLDKYARECGYLFSNPQMDTLALSRQMLRGMVGNYKLNTVSEFLGVELTGHHRALNDVLATAKIFMKLMKKKEEEAN